VHRPADAVAECRCCSSTKIRSFGRGRVGRRDSSQLLPARKKALASRQGPSLASARSSVPVDDNNAHDLRITLSWRLRSSSSRDRHSGDTIPRSFPSSPPMPRCKWRCRRKFECGRQSPESQRSPCRSTERGSRWRTASSRASRGCCSASCSGSPRTGWPSGASHRTRHCAGRRPGACRTRSCARA
jgi:hypothetical protein